MTKYLLLLTCCLCSVWANAQTEPLLLMPYPHTVERQQGQLVLSETIHFAIESKKSAATNQLVKELSKRIQQQTGQSVELKKTAASKAQLFIRIENTQPIANHIADWNESYQLNISAAKIELTAKQLVGAQRGLETLLQLIGTEPQIVLPLVSINDQPRFKWRGLLLDTSRHFFSVETIKRQLDAMAAAKYNIFHWHLTDDQGWRFESKKYPKLQQLASDGEFYTRQQMREIVAYAQARGIQVLPEIDMPGHASAIAVAYPELMSAPGPYAMEYRWGVHKPTLNPANENVYKFAEAIIAELTELFPFEYVHIGGDEVDPEHWNNNADIQTFMQLQGLKDHRALQAYFNQRVQKILHQHQRKMIGWDEIQHKDLPKDIVIQSWRGPDAVSESVAAGFQAILSTGYYLDQPQTAAYHYRNDPIPPTPYNHQRIENIPENQISSWSFEMPRQRGKPVTGSFTLINAREGFIDFTGKSRRAVAIQNLTQNAAVFSLDTWMGPVEFRVNFNGDNLQGKAIVGNAPYQLSGKKIAPKIASTEPAVTSLSAQQTQLILGGEAALWAEIVDEQSIDLRLWPRAFAVAERLWSAREVQDENSLYQRLNAVSAWAEKSTGLLHRQQQRSALVRLANTTTVVNSEADTAATVAALELLSETLAPAYYYHRQHEKSARETYSKADPLNRLVDALPVENERLRQFDLRLALWLKNPQENAEYVALCAQLQRWVKNRKALNSILSVPPSLRTIADKNTAIAELMLNLLQQHLSRELPDAAAQKTAQELITSAQQIDQEMVIALAFSAEKILSAFNSH